jgi:hypothetical protein
MKRTPFARLHKISLSGIDRLSQLITNLWLAVLIVGGRGARACRQIGRRAGRVRKAATPLNEQPTRRRGGGGGKGESKFRRGLEMREGHAGLPGE